MSALRLQALVALLALPAGGARAVGPVLFAGWLTFDEPPYPPGVASQWGVQGVWTIAHQFQASVGVYDNTLGSARGLSAWRQLTWAPRVNVNLTPLGGIVGARRRATPRSSCG
jgi:hypothetical protein